MSPSVKISLLIVLLMILLDILLLLIISYKRIKTEINRREGIKDKRTLLDVMLDLNASKKISIRDDKYFDIKQSVMLTKQYKERIERHINMERSVRKYSKRLHSVFSLRRTEAAVVLGLLGSDQARKSLEKSIYAEKDNSVRLFIANALSDIGSVESLPALTSSLLNSHHWYRDKVNMLLSDYGEKLYGFLPLNSENNRLEWVELIVDFASVYQTDQLKNYLLSIIDQRKEKSDNLFQLYGPSNEHHCSNCIYYNVYTYGEDRKCKLKGPMEKDDYCKKHKVLPISVSVASSYYKLVLKAAEVLADFYPASLDMDKYLESEDENIRNMAVRSLAMIHTRDNLQRLMRLIEDDTVARSAIYSAAQLLEYVPEYIGDVVTRFAKEENISIKTRMAQILSGRVEYFIMRLLTSNSRSAVDIIKQLLILGRTSEVIDFLNKNKDIDLENELLAILKEVYPESEPLQREIPIYLNGRLCEKLGVQHNEIISVKKVKKKDKKLARYLWIILMTALLFPPVAFIISQSKDLYTISWMELVTRYVVDFNYYLAYYSVAANVSYLVLLLFSINQVNQQSKRWNIKQTSMLFKKRILPSISIIAPAFNEEKTIIESINSLLNLKYPDYELIVVNDGSNDHTIERVIQYFNLVRIDYEYLKKLNTKPVRGVYINRSLPKLIVVDKVNGGKADSLNAGINISTKEYFCGIDADSLLESDALLKLSSLTLDHGYETPALGGNIFPVNGCVIENGAINEVHIPKEGIARLQNIEYIRAFMAGRLGWASLNSLLIISGAFGLFRKERIIGIGGYLTSSGKYEKDTVGEDMELVVRIRRLMGEMGSKYKICYAYNANCWTEVPQDLKSLKRQRYRWHRGLIDILTFHKRMLFNPRYGNTGLLAMPYFFLFELVGPILEAEGYLMVAVAFAMGLLNPEIALFLFISTILLGVLISISAVLISEKDMKYYKFHDVMILIWYAVIENFGPRQMISFWRVTGFLKMFGKEDGWGKAQRKGFDQQEPKK